MRRQTGLRHGANGAYLRKIPLQRCCDGIGAQRGGMQIRHWWMMDASASSAWSKSPRRRMQPPISPSPDVKFCPRYLRHFEKHDGRQERRGVDNRWVADAGSKWQSDRLSFSGQTICLWKRGRLCRGYQLFSITRGSAVIQFASSQTPTVR